MLGVRRAGVTEALQALTKEKLISSARSEIVVLDRKGLERRAGKSYGVPEAELRRLLGSAGIPRKRIDRTPALAHVPEKWKPVFRKGHAPINEFRAHPDLPNRDAL